ncbi:MAG: hypothetical protein OXG16_09290 [Rhodospirillales bacterium]|nr:hypothetical protein [Rhodospirillales bacterium]MDE0712776.1 hypothetical protein [Rhodospirillales bacterium]
MKPVANVLAVILVLTASACAGIGTSPPPPDQDGISFERNSEFSGPSLRVFVQLDDGGEASVNTVDDAIATRSGSTPIPGHQARNWTFVKDVERGTSVVYALVSWDPDNPADYLMAGWWAQFPGQHVPELSFRDSAQYAIADGPETDPSSPPDLPLEGQATYTGQAGGLYTYLAGSDWGEDEGAYVIDEYEGVITIAADFADATMSACIGCSGDLVTRRAHFGIFLGDELRDVQGIAADYELHFGETAFKPDGTFVYDDVMVRHPERTVTQSEGYWGGTLSNIPDEAGHPRLVAGFSGAEFEESDGSVGDFVGTFVALSEASTASAP